MNKLTMSSSRRLKELKAEEILHPAWLPDEIMYVIMSKLMVFPVYLAPLSAVCKRWHRLVCDAWPILLDQHHQTITTPLVLAPVVDRKELKEVAFTIYNLMGERALAPANNSLPEGRLTRIIGSSFGWLIVTNEETSSVSLFNPLSESHIRLPPIPNYKCYYAVKAVLSKPPEKEEEDFDIAITVNPGYWGTCKTARTVVFLHVEKINELKSLQWVVQEYSDYYHDQILDVNSVGGRICILHTDGTIRCCKCSTDGVSCYYGVIKQWPSWVLDSYPNLAITVYLLESSSSEPLVIFRYKDISCSGWPTVGFKIVTLTSNDEEIMNEFRKTWNWTEDKAKAVKAMTSLQEQQYLSILNWTEIKTLGNDVVFLSDKASICIQASKLQQPAASSIYYSQGTDFGAFNVERNCLTLFSHPSDDTILGTKLLQSRPPIWVQPSYDNILKFSSIG